MTSPILAGPKHRPGLPPMSARIARLPVDHRGYPVPFFVAWVNEAGQRAETGTGTPDFRVADGEKRERCVRDGLCWICGQMLGAYCAFVVGPMCAVNRISSEPPSHRDCAEFAVRACPFLVLPKAVRRDANLPDGRVEAAGNPLARNPGVSLIWVTKKWDRFRAFAGNDGVLWKMGDPTKVQCWAEGRKATVDEIRASVESGVPLLAASMDDAPDDERRQGLEQLAREVVIARTLLGIPAIQPAEATA